MKLLGLTIISFLVAFSNPSLEKKTVFQTIPIDHQLISVQTTLEKEIEILASETYEIRIETTVFFDSNDEDALNYIISQGHFDLTTHFSFDDTELTIAPKRINSTILTKGKKQEFHRQYRVYLPPHLICMD